jgi:hypothetical protein
MTTKPTTETKLALAEATHKAYMRIQNHHHLEGNVLAFMDGVLKTMAEDITDCHDHDTVKFICELFIEACDRQTLPK